jgi:hypothetical protein
VAAMPGRHEEEMFDQLSLHRAVWQSSVLSRKISLPAVRCMADLWRGRVRMAPHIKPSICSRWRQVRDESVRWRALVPTVRRHSNAKRWRPSVHSAGMGSE